MAAATEAGGEPRIDHYRANVPTTPQAAKEQWNAGMVRIGRMLGQASLSHQDMEAVHEVTYQLEAVLELWRDQGVASVQMPALTRAVERLHQTSEHRQEEALRQAYAAVKQHAQQDLGILPTSGAAR